VGSRLSPTVTQLDTETSATLSVEFCPKEKKNISHVDWRILGFHSINLQASMNTLYQVNIYQSSIVFMFGKPTQLSCLDDNDTGWENESNDCDKLTHDIIITKLENALLGPPAPTPMAHQINPALMLRMALRQFWRSIRISTRVTRLALTINTDGITFESSCGRRLIPRD